MLLKEHQVVCGKYRDIGPYSRLFPNKHPKILTSDSHQIFDHYQETLKSVIFKSDPHFTVLSDFDEENYLSVLIEEQQRERDRHRYHEGIWV